MKWGKICMITNKLKKIKGIKRIVLFTLALVLTNCQHEENTVEQSKSSIQTVSINEAKSFLTTSKKNLSSKSSASQLENLELDKIRQEKLSNTDQLLTVIPVKRTNTVQFDRILLLKVNNEIRSVVYKMYSDEPQIKSPFSGKVLIYDLDGNFINGFHLENGKATLQYIKKSSKSITNKTSSDEVYGGNLEGVTVYNRYRYNKFIPEIADWGWGDNLSGGGGGGEVTWEQDPGAGDTGGSDSTKEDYPDCASINFIKMKGIPWQEAAIKNITFNIVIIQSLTPLRTSMETVTLPQAVSFQMPTNTAVGNTEITPGVAASTAAEAINRAMTETKEFYKNVPATELMVDQFFRNALKNAFELMSPGSRLVLNPGSTVPPTEYKSNWFFPSDCK